MRVGLPPAYEVLVVEPVEANRSTQVVKFY